MAAAVAERAATKAATETSAAAFASTVAATAAAMAVAASEAAAAAAAAVAAAVAAVDAAGAIPEMKTGAATETAEAATVDDDFAAEASAPYSVSTRFCARATPAARPVGLAFLVLSGIAATARAAARVTVDPEVVVRLTLRTRGM